ncbi:hypothetical protein GASC598B02_002040, partial [Gilliamella apicola SCGC AB-598-B02]
NPTLNNKYRFHRGYTENYMDYAQHVDLSQNNKVGKNKYYRQMYSFFKWQWKLMRDDKKSIEL